MLRHARAHHWNVDALLLTGDLVNDDPGGYAVAREMFGDLGKPVWCLPGNQDDFDLMARELGGAPFQVGGFLDRGAWRIVMLDSCVAGQAHGQLRAAELARHLAGDVQVGGVGLGVHRGVVAREEGIV